MYVFYIFLSISLGILCMVHEPLSDRGGKAKHGYLAAHLLMDPVEKRKSKFTKIDDLAKGLENSSESIRQAAADKLIKMGSSALPILTSALKMKDKRDTQRTAVLALAEIGILAEPVLSELRTL